MVRNMDSDTIILIVAGAVLAGVLLLMFVAYWRRRLRRKRLGMTEQFKQYFHGEMPVDQLGRQIRQMASRHFLGSAEFYSLATSAFQRAVDTRPAHPASSQEAERRLLGLLAALKREFGLTDRYQIEAWRAGRE
jgi:hypothetical protein